MLNWYCSLCTLCCLIRAELILQLWQLVYTVLSVSCWADTAACVHCAGCFVLSWYCSYQSVCTLCCMFRAELILQFVNTVLSVSCWTDTTVITACLYTVVAVCVHYAICFALSWYCSYQSLCTLRCLFRADIAACVHYAVCFLMSWYCSLCTFCCLFRAELILQLVYIVLFFFVLRWYCNYQSLCTPCSLFHSFVLLFKIKNGWIWNTLFWFSEAFDLQSPNCAANFLLHIGSSDQGGAVCKSCATHGVLITRNISCATWCAGTTQLLSLTESKSHILALFYWLKPLVLWFIALFLVLLGMFVIHQSTYLSIWVLQTYLHIKRNHKKWTFTKSISFWHKSAWCCHLNFNLFFTIMPFFWYSKSH